MLTEKEVDYVGTIPSPFPPVTKPGLMSIIQDFMAIRKIPMKEREKFQGEGLTAKDINPETEDPEVNVLLDKMRTVVCKDRDLHDKVRIPYDTYCVSHS